MRRSTVAVGAASAGEDPGASNRSRARSFDRGTGRHDAQQISPQGNRQCFHGKVVTERWVFRGIRSTLRRYGGRGLCLVDGTAGSRRADEGGRSQAAARGRTPSAVIRRPTSRSPTRASPGGTPSCARTATAGSWRIWTVRTARSRGPGASGAPASRARSSSGWATPPAARRWPARFRRCSTRASASTASRPPSFTSRPVRCASAGRPDNDLVISDLSVSRHHAELRTDRRRYEIVDLGSHNGTFVNGQRIDQRGADREDIVGIGRSTFRLVGDELQEFVDTGDVSFAAQRSDRHGLGTARCCWTTSASRSARSACSGSSAPAARASPPCSAR